MATFDGIQSYWKFDETSGTTAYDSVGSVDGTLTKVSFVSCKINNGVKFTGSTAVVNLGDNIELEYNEPFSLAFWYKCSAGGDRNGRFLEKAYAPGYTFEFDDTELRMRLGASGSQLYKVWDTMPDDGNWHHVVYTYNGSGALSGATAYIDGSIQTSTYSSGSVSGTIKNNNDAVIKSQQKAAAIETYVDEFGYWNRVLSSTEVSDLYNGGSGKTYYPPLYAGTIAVAQTICDGDTPSGLTTTVSPTGGTGTYALRWYSGTTSGATSLCPTSATGTTFQPPALSVNTWYKKRVISNAETGYTNTIKITVNTKEITSNPSNDSCCEGFDAQFTMSASGTTGLTYRWQYDDGSTVWQDLADGAVYAGTATDTLDVINPPVSYNGYLYRCKVSDACSDIYTTSATLNVYATPAAPTATNKTICCDGSSQMLSVSSSPVGTIKWYSDAGLTTLVGSGITYTPNNSCGTATNYYVVDDNSGCVSPSTTVTLTIRADIVNNTIGSNQSICFNTAPAQLTGSTPSGGCGTYSYLWQYDSGGGWTSASGTGKDFNPPPLMQTTQYRRRVISCSPPCVDYSNTITITVYDDFIPFPNDYTIYCCNGIVPPNYIMYAPSGGEGNYTYQWVSGYTTTPTSIMAGYTGDTIQPPALTQTTYYRQIQSDTCGSGYTGYVKYEVAALVDDLSNPTGVTKFVGETAIFKSTTTDSIATWQWEKSADSGATWSNVTSASPYSGFNTDTLTINPVNAGLNGYQYRMKARIPVGLGGCYFYSSAATLTVLYNLTPTVTHDFAFLPDTSNFVWSLPYPSYGTGVRVDYRVSGTTGWTAYNTYPTGTTSAFLTGLTPNTTYELRVVALGSEYPSATYTFTTPPLPPTGKLYQFGFGASFSQVGTGNTYTDISALQTDGGQLIKSDNSLWTYGLFTLNGLGYTGSTGDRTVPVLLTGGTWSLLSDNRNGVWNNHAIKSDGTLWGWGENSRYNLGDGTTTHRYAPVQIGAGKIWKAISNGSFYYSMGITTDGKLWSWGQNANYQTGLNTAVGYTTTITQVGTGTTWESISLGYGIGAGIKSDGTLWTWGDNTSGLTAQGTTVGYTTVPTQVGSDTDWMQVHVTGIYNGVLCAYAVKTNGNVYGWGANQNYQLGLNQNTTKYYTSPVQITGITDVTKIAAGYGCCAALKSDNTLWSWGWGDSGSAGQHVQGHNEAITQFPNQLQTGFTFADISYGYYLQAISADYIPVYGQVMGTGCSAYEVCDGTATFYNQQGGSGSYEYSIDSGATWQATSGYTGLCAGDYYCWIRDVSDSGNTYNIGTLTISQPAPILFPASFCETAPYTISASTCGNADGKITIVTPVGLVEYLTIYDFTLTDVDGNSYIITTGATFTGLTSSYYFLTATVKPAYWYYYGRETCTFDWIKIVDSDTTMVNTGKSVRNVVCGGFGKQQGRIAYTFAETGSTPTYTAKLYEQDTYQLIQTVTGSTVGRFIFAPLSSGNYYLVLKDAGGCTVLIDNTKVGAETLRSVAGVRRLWLTEWSNTVEYNYWSQSDEDYYLSDVDANFFNSIKIKSYIDSTLPSVWYSMNVHTKSVTFSQGMNKTNQGFIFTDKLTVTIPNADNAKWKQLVDILTKRYILVFEDNNGLFWTMGYRHGAQVQNYSLTSNEYVLEFYSVSENKILTNISEDYIRNSIL